MPNRYICSVFEEMREAHKSRNYSYLKGLIEEAQVLANRMEAAISTKNDVKYMEKRAKKLKKDIERLEEKKEELEET